MSLFHFVNLVIFQFFAGVTSTSPKFDLFLQFSICREERLFYFTWKKSEGLLIGAGAIKGANMVIVLWGILVKKMDYFLFKEWITVIMDMIEFLLNFVINAFRSLTVIIIPPQIDES